MSQAWQDVRDHAREVLSGERDDCIRVGKLLCASGCGLKLAWHDVFLLLIAPQKYARGFGGSTAGPSHFRTNSLAVRGCRELQGLLSCGIAADEAGCGIPS
jgi:hypothetical protein